MIRELIGADLANFVTCWLMDRRVPYTMGYSVGSTFIIEVTSDHADALDNAIKWGHDYLRD